MGKDNLILKTKEENVFTNRVSTPLFHHIKCDKQNLFKINHHCRNHFFENEKHCNLMNTNRKMTLII